MTPDESFKKREHLLKSKDFNRVYRGGAAHRADYGRMRNALTLYRLPNALGNNRIGFSIGSRYVKLASARNRIRRLFREVYRRRKKDLKRGFDIVLVVKKNLGKAVSYKDVEGLFLELAKGSGLLK